MRGRSDSWLPLSAAAVQVWAIDQIGEARASDGRRNGVSSRPLTALAARLAKVLRRYRTGQT